MTKPKPRKPYKRVKGQRRWHVIAFLVRRSDRVRRAYSIALTWTEARQLKKEMIRKGAMRVRIVERPPAPPRYPMRPRDISHRVRAAMQLAFPFPTMQEESCPDEKQQHQP
jgi:hypothetical protein